jgi:hypothetical protein
MVSFFIPKKINVGFQERNDTYTGKLAYIIYFDEKGKLRKEKSWDGWRDKKIDNQIHENEPASGFVLNKKAGGYDTGWNHRQTYVRVYDPRGFEFEITVSNLLYILENATSTKGKGLEGDFVYGWDGKDLVLIPVESPDYQELVKLNELRHSENNIKAKELIIGATYRTRQNHIYIYMGKFDYYNWNGVKDPKQQFYFYERNESGGFFIEMKTVSKKLVEVISEESVEDYADIFDILERQYNYSPIDKSKDEYIPYTLEEVIEQITNDKSGWRRNYMYVYSDFQGEIEQTTIQNYHGNPTYYQKKLVTYTCGWRETKTRMENVSVQAESLEEIFNILKPMWKKVYLANGKLYKEEK